MVDGRNRDHPVPSSEQEIQEAISEQKTPAIQSRNPAIQSQKLQPIQSPETPAIQKPKTPAISSSRKLQAIIREARNSAIQRPETPASQIPELQGPPTMIQSAEKLQPIHVPETPAIQSQKLQPFRQKLSSHSSQKPPCHSEPETLAIQSQKLRLTNSRTASSIAEPDLRPLAEPHPNPAIQFPENTHAIQESQRQHAYSQPETAQPLEPQHLLPAIQPSRKPSPFEPELQPYHVPETPPFRSPTHSSKQIIQFTRNSSHSERSPAFRAQKLSPFSRPDTPAHSDVRPALQPFRARNSSHSEPRKSTRTTVPPLPIDFTWRPSERATFSVPSSDAPRCPTRLTPKECVACISISRRLKTRWRAPRRRIRQRGEFVENNAKLDIDVHIESPQPKDRYLTRLICGRSPTHHNQMLRRMEDYVNESFSCLMARALNCSSEVGLVRLSTYQLYETPPTTEDDRSENVPRTSYEQPRMSAPERGRVFFSLEMERAGEG
ncbi:hypothetical protein C7M84_017910 [Penaeus vannamei]|uniref:Uncharacterized protein n=1 Tax=Penaeus vannamei TaxID=6689 RepID=A0A3R7P8Y1_PENVA|nr:hypothetical protein C7M84_017910 [Penaeus vannamei]